MIESRPLIIKETLALPRYLMTIIEPASISEATLDTFLEYLPGSQRIEFFNWLDKVLVPEAKVHISVPYHSHPQAWSSWALQWPPMSEHSFLFLSKPWRDERPFYQTMGYTCDLDTVSYEYTMVDDWLTRHDNTRTFGIQHYFGVVTQLHITLIKSNQTTTPVT